MGDFRMPSLGADMDAGTVTEWLVKPGDEVRRGDIVAVVETEKSTIEVEIFESGVIEEILVEPGKRVAVGTALARVRSAVAEPSPTLAPVALSVGPPGATSVVEEAVRAPQTLEHQPSPAPEGEAARVVSPLIRHLAQELGVDLSTVRGSGRGGTVTRADVEKAAAATTTLPAQGRARSSPLARRVAAELGVELSGLSGSGPGGSITESDVRRAAAANPEAIVATPPAVAERFEEPTASAIAEPVVVGAVEERQAAMRKAIGALMARSKREVPHYYLSTTIDMGEALSWLERANLERSVTQRLVAPVLLLKATALALSKVPEMNGFWVDDSFVASAAVHVGVAVSMRGGGVIAPAIHDTDKLSLDELMAALRDLVVRARKGVLRSSEMSDPTVTVTNLGDLGVEAVFGVIYPPQVALVGFGRVLQRPWASEGMLGVRPCVTATLSADHRVSDGHRGALFLAEIDRLLREPEKL